MYLQALTSQKVLFFILTHIVYVFQCDLNRPSKKACWQRQNTSHLTHQFRQDFFILHFFYCL